MVRQPTVMIVAGETSGDLHGAGLMLELQRRRPGIRFCGMGGRRMRAAGLEPTISGEGIIGTAGLVEVLSGLGTVLSGLREIKMAMDREPPDLFIPVDFPDFNFRLGHHARKRGIPVAYFISPQVWAWRRGRIRTLFRMVKKMLVIFPFEEEIFRRGGIDTVFVGHPLLDRIGPGPDREQRLDARQALGLGPDEQVVALLPGSRKNEVRRILPTMIEAAGRAAASRALRFLLVRAAHLEGEAAMDRLLSGQSLPGLQVVPETQLYPVLRAADAAIVASGTVTLETALHQVPMAVVYRVSPLTYFLGRALVKLENFAMVNLIAGRQVVPELIQGDLTAPRLVAELTRLLDPVTAAPMRTALQEVRSRLGAPGAYGRSADEILRLL